MLSLEVWGPPDLRAGGGARLRGRGAFASRGSARLLMAAFLAVPAAITAILGLGISEVSLDISTPVRAGTPQRYYAPPGGLRDRAVPLDTLTMFRDSTVLTCGASGTDQGVPPPSDRG
ncbi:MAG: hypothetical protein ACXQTN_00440 [Methanoculleaceae archaeon]